MEIGPLLRQVLRSQALEAEATTFPAIEIHAAMLVELTESLGGPVVLAVGVGAERVLGAATIISHGILSVYNWDGDLQGRDVLLFTVVAMTPLALQAASEQALRMGAHSVEAVGIEMDTRSWSELRSIARLHRLSDVGVTTANR